MRFADPQACPDCRGAIAGQPSCPQCGLDLTSVEVRQLWQTLLQADDLLARALKRPRVPAPGAVAQPVATPSGPAPDPFVAAPPTWRPYPAPPAPVAAGGGAAPAGAMAGPGRSWSVGTVLLVLGAFGLVVAGLIFVTRSWDDLGLAGRTLILLGVTALVGGLGVWVTRRPLRASAEAVWTVFLALLTLDFFAARHEDLAGLGAVSTGGGWVVWGVVALALSVAISVAARPHVGTALVAPAVAAGLAITTAGIGAGALLDDRSLAWRAVAALAVAGVLALATRPAALAPTTLAAQVVVAGFFTVAYGTSVVELADHPAIDDLAGGGHGGPLLVMGLASLVIAAVVRVARVPATTLAMLAVSALAVAPVADGGGETALWVLVSVAAAVLAAVGVHGSNDWMQGVRVGSLAAVVGLLLVHVVLVAEMLETIGRIADDPWASGWTTRVDAASVGDHTAWAVPVVLLGLLVAAWFVPHWPEVEVIRPHAPAVVGTALAVGATGSVVALRWPVWLTASSLVVLAIALAAVRVRRLLAVPTVVTAGLVLVAAGLAAASQGVSVATWLVGGVVLVAVALVSSGDALRHVHAVLGVGLVLADTAALVDLLDLDGSVTALVVVVVALALMAAAQLAPGEHPVAPAIEIASAVGLAVGLVGPGSSGEIAVRWTVAGVVLVALSFAATGRRWLLWPGIGALVVAYVALIVDSGFSFVEAYTLPLGAAGLAVGTFAATKKATTSTWTLLGPGLALALLPSVPQALADPTGLRALLLGVAAVAVLAAGVRLGWQAPFVAGVVIATLLVLFNIGPYANAAPRVVVIAVVSAVLLGFGITWEDRVRDGRKLVSYVRSMR